MRRLALIGVLAICTVGLAACGGSSGASNGGNGAASSTRYPASVTRFFERQCQTTVGAGFVPADRSRLCTALTGCLEHRVAYAQVKSTSTHGYAIGQKAGAACLAPAVSALGPAPPISIPPLASADERQAAAVSVAYLEALSRGNWAAVCATRTHADRRQIAHLGGTCESGFAVLGQRLGPRLAYFERATFVTVRRRGGVIGVHFRAPLAGDVALAALKDAGSWRLEDVPDAEIP